MEGDPPNPGGRLSNGGLDITNGIGGGSGASPENRVPTRYQCDQSLEWSLVESSSSDDEKREKTVENGEISPGWLCRYYKKFDEYWNVFPKTDYTYSPSSHYNGKQVAPGVPIIPNLSRRSIFTTSSSSSPSERLSTTSSSSVFSRTTANHRYSTKSSSSMNSSAAPRGNYYKTIFNSGLSNSEEILQNIHNSNRRSGWQRVRDVWTSVWWTLYRIVIITVQTCTTIVTTTSTTIVSTSKAVAVNKIARLSLLPLLLLLLIYLFRNNLVTVSNERWWPVIALENAADSREVISYLLSPLYSLYQASNWAFLLVTRSVVMIPTLFNQLVSLLWSFLVLMWPSHVWSLLLNATSTEVKPVTDQPSMPVTKFEGHQIITQARDIQNHHQTSVEEIRKVVMDVLEEQEKQKTQWLSMVDERIRLSQQKLTESMKEMAQRLKEEELTKASNLEASLRQRIDAAKHEMADLEELVNTKVKETLETPEIRGVDETWKRGVAEDLRVTGEKLKAEIEQEMHRRLDEETREKVRALVLETGVLTDLTESSRQQIADSLDHQRNEWKTILEKLEMKLNEVDKSNIKKEELDSKLTDLRNSALKEIQNQIYRLESNSFARGITSADSLNKNEGDMKGSLEVANDSETSLQRAEIEDLIVTYVEKVLAKYHADQIGMPDYALQSSGATIVGIRCTSTYPIGGQRYSFGLPWGSPLLTSPDTILKPGVIPGHCWAFVGSQGYVIIKLAARIKVTSFTMEHMPKEISPHGHIKSAPKDFSVWGLIDENDPDPVLLGSFTFLDNGKSLQQYLAKEYESEDGGFDMIELKIESNHGHPDFTCLYRFRVHGIPINGLL